MDPIANQLNIETPELVSIELPVAGIGSRFIAIVVDYLIWTFLLILFAVFGTVILSSLQAFGAISANWVIGVVVLLVFLFHWGYFTLFEAFNDGRTPGKRVARIRVIHSSGRAVNFVEALARNLVRFVDYLPSFYGVGLIVMFLSRLNQRLGDMVAGTLVVRDRQVESPHWGESGSGIITAPTAFAPMPAPHMKVVLSIAGLAKLNTADLGVLEGFFARRLDMDLATRAALAQRMAQALCVKSGLEIPEGTSVETFLEAVAHQLREIARMS